MKLDPKDAAGIERAAALVYEAVTGLNAYTKHGFIYNKAANLATSLDAWRPLWEKMGDVDKEEIESWLHYFRKHGEMDVHYDFETPAIYILEAALKALGLVEKWEAGE